MFRVAYRKFADASLASGDAMAHFYWAETYQTQARIVSDPAKKIYLMRNSCDNFKTAHILRKNDMNLLSTFVDAEIELAGILPKDEAVQSLFEVVDAIAKRFAHFSLMKRTSILLII